MEDMHVATMEGLIPWPVCGFSGHWPVPPPQPSPLTRTSVGAGLLLFTLRTHRLSPYELNWLPMRCDCDTLGLWGPQFSPKSQVKMNSIDLWPIPARNHCKGTPCVAWELLHFWESSRVKCFGILFILNKLSSSSQTWFSIEIISGNHPRVMFKIPQQLGHRRTPEN